MAHFPKPFFKGSSGNLVASFRHQIELSSVEQNSQAVVLEISKSPGGGLDGLDPAVESAHIAFATRKGYILMTTRLPDGSKVTASTDQSSSRPRSMR